VLDAVHDNGTLTQRSLSKELGIALGLTNAYLKRCVRMGLIKVRAAPPNRYVYYLTPKGFAEKSRLTARYLSRSFHFYGQARTDLGACFATCAARGWRRLALYGAGELAEIALLCAMQYPVGIVGVVDARAGEGRFMKLPRTASLAALGPVDAALITDLRRPQATYEAAREELAAERLLTPALLKISRRMSLNHHGEE